VSLELDDEELSELHSLLCDYLLYGPQGVVYGSEGDTLRIIAEKVTDEAKRRRLWWAR
jgi:hypothetical protein